MEKHLDISQRRDMGNCSTIIIGKNASTTGRVLLAHNEDDYDCTVQMHRVPRVLHKEGETISFADGNAIIPEVPETYAYLWSEMRAIGGISFADGFVNEWGVAVVTDSCKPCKVTDDEPQETGLGYGLRRLIAERAKTAREGVEVAAALVAEFGYTSSRTYHICDKDEAWSFQVGTGKRYVARRVPDDHVYYMPNHFTIHQVDFSDTEHKNFYFSEDLAEYPIRHGWYTPAVAGDYSDFDFAKAYQGGNVRTYNMMRTRIAWGALIGEVPGEKPFSAKAPRMYGPEDLKKILRSHGEGTEDDHSECYARNPHLDRNPSTICNSMTLESSIVEFHDDPNLTCYWRAVTKACISPFVPWYPNITTVPTGYSWVEPTVSQPTHFCPAEEELAYNPTRAHWAFRTLQYLTEFDYKNTHGVIQESYGKLESAWVAERPVVIDTYTKLAAICPEQATEYLTSYTATQAQKAWDWANAMIQQLGEAKIVENGTSGLIPQD